MKRKKIILASRSAQRLALLSNFHLDIEVDPADIDEESIQAGLDTALKRAQAKARVIALKRPDDSVLAADTIVVSEQKNILGTPANIEEAKEILKQLWGSRHQVISAACFIEKKKEVTFVEIAYVTLKKASELEIKDYLETGESLGKAGGLCVQGLGKKFVEKLEGEEAAVIGLPLKSILEYFNSKGNEI